MKLAPALLTLVLTLALAACSWAQEPQGDDEFFITADNVEYSEVEAGRVLSLSDNVTITRAGAKLVGQRGLYYEYARRALLFGGVSGMDGGRSVACDTLEYFSDSDVAHLIGHASYSDSTGTTTADRISLLRAENVAVCRGNVTSSDHEGTSKLHAGWLVYDFDRGEARATREPELVTYSDDGEVDGRMTAEAIEIVPEYEVVRAFGSVDIEREDIRATARTAVLGTEGSIALEGDPVVRQGEDRLEGERIRVATADGEVSRVVALGRALASYHIEPETPDEKPSSGTVGGDTLTMFMADGKPVLTTVRGTATSEHAVGDAGEKNVVTCRAIDVLFDDGRIKRVAFRGNAFGKYSFPPDALDAAASEGAPAEAEAGDTTGVESGAAELEHVSYESDEINYYVERNRILLSGHARVEYQTTVLHADDVMFDPSEQVLEATGNPDLREKADRLIGARLTYDLEAKSGAIEEGVTTFEDGLYYGGRIVRDEDGTLAVRRGVYTTCSDPEPHFSLVSHRMKIYLDDKVVARPVILYIGRIPVLALPFYVFPIRTERHSGFLLPQIEFGLSGDGGRFVRNFGYYWAPNDYWDASVWADYYELTKWIGHIETRYKKRYSLSGSVSASFMEELLYNKRRWDLKFSHRQEFGRTWTAGASGDFRSDATYASDSNQSIQESVNRSLHSQLWVRGRWSSHTLGVTLDRREQLDAGTVRELLPKVELTASQQPVLKTERELGPWLDWLTNVSYSWSAKAVNDREDVADEEVEVHQGLGLKGSLRTSEKVLGWLTLSPRMGIAQNWYDRDREGERFASRLTYDAGVSARTTVYGTFFPALAGLQAVRHIIEPSASFSWTPEFPQYFDENDDDLFYTFSGFGSTPRSKKSVNLSLVNKLQVKLGSGEDTRKIDNLFRLSNSTSYDFKKDDRQWSDIRSGLEFRPGSAVSLRWDARHDAYDGGIESSTITATLGLRGESPPASAQPWEDRVIASDSPADQLRSELAAQALGDTPGRKPWDASATFRYSRGADPSNASYWADGRLALSLSEHWRVNYSIHYDLSEQEVASQEYTLYRDLHCWEAQFTQRYYEGEWEYYFRISVKALPEIQAEAGRKFLQRSVR